MEIDWGNRPEPTPRVETVPASTTTAVLEVPTNARNATLTDVVDMLKVQHDLKYDVVVPSELLSFQAGMLVIQDGAVELTDTGAVSRDAHLSPTHGFDGAIAEKLGIPRQYLRTMRTIGKSDPGVLELLDHNVNEWMERSNRNWFVRGFRTDDPWQVGVARAFLSDKYELIDNLDVLMTTLDAMNRAGLHAEVHSANLTDTMMDVKIYTPEVRARADEFLKGYRSPFSGIPGTDLPHIFAGYSLRNSETGGGAYTLMPQVIVEVCTNGMSITRDLMRRVHLGAQMEEGPVRWSEETRHHYIELVRNQTADAVRTFLSQDYIEQQAIKLNEMAGVKLDKPIDTVRTVTQQLGYSEDEQRSILNLFAQSGDNRAVGVMQAATAYAQVCDNPVRSQEIEDQALELVRVASQV